MSAHPQEESHATDLERVATMFAQRPELRWMLASASVLRAYKIMSQRVTAVLGEIRELSISRYEILALLAGTEQGTLAVRELKAASIARPVTLTYVLDWLETRKLVRRRNNREDRRSVLITITNEGRELFEQATTALLKIDFGLVGLDDNDAQAVALHLTRVRRP